MWVFHLWKLPAESPYWQFGEGAICWLLGSRPPIDPSQRPLLISQTLANPSNVSPASCTRCPRKIVVPVVPRLEQISSWVRPPVACSPSPFLPVVQADQMLWTQHRPTEPTRHLTACHPESWQHECTPQTSGSTGQSRHPQSKNMVSELVEPDSPSHHCHHCHEVYDLWKELNNALIQLDLYSKFKIIGASLSEPHTSVTAFAEVGCMSVCGHIP